MPEHPVRRRGAQAAYFFLSYGRTPSRPGERQHPDKNLIRFYESVATHLMQFTDLEGGIAPGYLDRRTEIGTPWRQELRKALATCQVLVPVLSRRYITSEWCGREWQAFEHRQQLQRDKGTFTRSAIVPVIWTPLDAADLPRVVREVQYTHDDLGYTYRQEGLYALMAADRRTAYNRATLEIARTIEAVARSSRLEQCDPDLLDGLGNAFEEES
ncbi:TIR-like protein FxsC [Streptomyces sp. SPB162]|uniref:TIR-like protein FxsC n=1 Tax=Streptomyces sp. SPB162 TaxID=2940560 RepID=UPI002405DA54|nr:TIR-like protein FxsC [Streptomyces sp. SPB162]MDF9810788.1 hypothetical protein [Streptomyces sp. SPB162]